MAVVDGDVLGGASNGTGGVFAVPNSSSGALDVSPLNETGEGLVYQLIAGADEQLYFGWEPVSTPELIKYDYGAASPRVSERASTNSVIRAAPVLGSDGLLYSIGADGELTAWRTANLSTQWRVPGVGSNVEASPTLDCSRRDDGTPVGATFPGVLYVAAGGKLHAFVVDSPRMPNEGWPKYQHDARNTGNPDKPITNCP
jgi:hypothetical protein